MATRIRQSAKIPHGTRVTVNNNFPRKNLRIKNIPLGSTIRVDKSFVKPEDLKTKMSKIKASSKFKSGKSEYRKLKSIALKPGDTVNIKIKTS